jgi:hypothetical protein
LEAIAPDRRQENGVGHPAVFQNASPGGGRVIKDGINYLAERVR